MILITDESIDSQLVDHHLKIVNARDDEAVNGPMKLFNYDEARFDEGLVLYKAAYALQQQTKIERSEQVAATEAYHKAFSDTHKTYMQHVTIARVVTRGMIQMRNLTGLDLERNSTFSGWLMQAEQFYGAGTANAGFLALMANYGITLEMLEANKAALGNVDLLKKRQSRETGDAQQATKLRDKAFDLLHRWVMAMVAIARIALADTPQLLEKLNIIVPS